jgi:tRNA isopentenyl-2-thiomethyl-A-37 hydroxylase MiaE
MYSILDSEYYSKIDKTTTKENQTFLVKLIITDYLTINNEERKKVFLKVEQGLNLELLELIVVEGAVRHDGEFLALMSKDVLDNEDLLDEFGYCREDIEVII